MPARGGRRAVLERARTSRSTCSPPRTSAETRISRLGLSPKPPRSKTRWCSEQRARPLSGSSGPPAECHMICAASKPISDSPKRPSYQQTAHLPPKFRITSFLKWELRERRVDTYVSPTALRITSWRESGNPRSNKCMASSTTRFGFIRSSWNIQLGNPPSALARRSLTCASPAWVTPTSSL